MRKQFLSKSQWLLFINVMICTPLHGMDIIPFDVKKEITFYVDSAMHRTIALVDTIYNKIIEDNHRPYKKRIEELMCKKGISLIRGHVSWNKDFSKCAWIKTSDRTCSHREIVYGTELKKLELTKVECFSKNIMSREVFDNVCFPVIEGDSRPFFNREGSACFHTFGYSYLLRGPVWKGVRLLSLNFKGEKTQINCCIEGEKNITYNFDILFNLPVLMKALLQSTKVRSCYKSLWASNAYDRINHQPLVGWTKLYSIKGATIPENYKLFKKHPLVGFLPYGLYNDLPGDFRKAIEKRCAQQEQEKKVIEWQEWERNNTKKL